MITPNRKLILVLLALFIGESAVMGLINYLQLPALAEAFVDAAVLITIALPILFISFVRPMIQQYHEVEEARKTAETLLNTSIELSQSLELSAVMSILLRRVREVLPYKTAAIYLSQSPTWLTVRAVEGIPSADPAVSGVDPEGHATIQAMLSKQKVVFLADTRNASSRLELAETNQARSWVGIPLVAGGKTTGFCGFGHNLPHAFSPDQIHLAEGLISLATVAIQNAHLYEQVRLAREHLQSLTRETMNIHERERRLLSRDLYDDAGQALASVLVKVQLLAKDAASPEIVNQHAQELHSEIAQMLDNLQNIAINLRPASLEHLGLTAAIQHDLDRLHAKHGLTTKFDVIGFNQRLPEPVETALFRIVQEALSNVIAHACATKVEVSLSRQDDWLVLVISDNGQGFRTETISTNCCLGLLGMSERAEMVQGHFTVESEPGSGTAVIVRVPLN